MTIPYEVKAAMAEAMLDPQVKMRLRFDPLACPPMPDMGPGNKVRIAVLERALEAARQLGWELMRTGAGEIVINYGGGIACKATDRTGS